MHLRWFIIVGSLLAAASLGCATGHLAKNDAPATPLEPAPLQSSTQTAQLVAFSQPLPSFPGEASPGAATTAQGVPDATVGNPPPPYGPEALPPPDNRPHAAGPGQPLTLADLEAIALGNNPTLALAAARVAAARGNAFQTGLWRNPVVGYQGNDIGNEGRAGQQGMFVEQEFDTGGKLRLSRLTAEQVARRREYELVAQRFRVLNDVRTQFYEALTAQRQTELSRQRLKLLEKSADETERLFKVEEASRIEVLQIRIEVGQARLVAETTANRYEVALRRLAAVLGTPEQLPAPLAGDAAWERLAAAPDAPGKAPVPPKLPVREWPSALALLLGSSPELLAASAGIREAQWALDRAQAEPIPNVTVQAGAQYDNATRDTFANVQLGVPLPVFNRNQGGIAKAAADLTAAQRRFASVQLALHTRLAEAFERYANARRQVEGYLSDIVPKALEARGIIDKYYRKERDLPALLAYLSSQRTLFEAQLAYLNAVKELHQSVIAIDGLVLTGSLSAAASE